MTAATPVSPRVRAAYAHCEQVTRTEARNFSYGIMLLPPAKRNALSAVYAFARRVDDIGDGDLPAPARLAGLAAAREQVEDIAAGRGPAGGSGDDLVLVALADAAARFPVPLGAFGELIEGCEDDVRGAAYATWADLERYCRCVAGSIGRLSLGVFGAADLVTAAPLADSLGVALQLTNILRDIREDFGNGRVYLPAEDLARFGVALTPGAPAPWASGAGAAGLHGAAGAGESAGMAELIRFEVERAQSWYAAGLALMPMLDWRARASAGAMAGIYLRLLTHIAARPGAVLEGRMSLPGREKAAVAARALLGQPPRRPSGARESGAVPAGTPADRIPAAGIPGAARSRSGQAGADRLTGREAVTSVPQAAPAAGDDPVSEVGDSASEASPEPAGTAQSPLAPATSGRDQAAIRGQTMSPDQSTGGALSGETSTTGGTP